MVSRSSQSTEVQEPAPQQRAGPTSAGHADRVAPDHASRLVQSALAFAARCHAPQRRKSDGAAFIEHPLEVAGLLHDAGCSDVLVAAGLLHDVVEDTHVGVAELTERFGKDVSNLVRAVSEDASIDGYRERKQALREQIRRTGRDAALVFAADKVSKVRELPTLVRHERARFDTTPRGHRARKRVEHDHEMRLEHYLESLSMLQQVAPEHPLVKRLATELNNCRRYLAPS